VREREGKRGDREIEENEAFNQNEMKKDRIKVIKKESLNEVVKSFM